MTRTSGEDMVVSRDASSRTYGSWKPVKHLPREGAPVPCGRLIGGLRGSSGAKVLSGANSAPGLDQTPRYLAWVQPIAGAQAYAGTRNPRQNSLLLPSFLPPRVRSVKLSHQRDPLYPSCSDDCHFVVYSAELASSCLPD